MCGIAGEVRFDQLPADTDPVLKMCESMIRRGPDGEGLWRSPDGDVVLGHRRLAILDLSERGAQPMASEDGDIVVVFNGEIYNHLELRKEYEDRGARYRSDSDTETLLHGYRLEGTSFIRRLRGMFAFALWDRTRRCLLIARDLFGIKPLYYAHDGGRIRFASQVKALLAGGHREEVSSAGLVSFLLWGYVTEPHTFYRGIRSLPAGSYLTWFPGTTPQIHRYADPLGAIRGQYTANYSGSLHDALLDSVRHHLLADVPVGIFLSAGIDSGTLAAYMKECQPKQNIQAITLSFQEYAGTNQNEVPMAMMTAKRYGLQHEVVQFERTDFEDERQRLLIAMDQPTVDAVNTYFVSKAAAGRGLKVALSAIGGDEIFGGYSSFQQIPSLVKRLQLIPASLGKAFREVMAPIISYITSPKYAGTLEYGGNIAGAYLLRRSLFMPWEISTILGEQLAKDGLEELDVLGFLNEIIEGINSPYEQVMALEYMVYMRNCLLRDSDWAGMAHSLEIRTPLVDQILFENILSLSRMRQSKLFTKQDFAQSPNKPLSVEHRNRPKTGFSVPIRDWITGPSVRQNRRGLRPWAISLLSAYNVFN